MSKTTNSLDLNYIKASAKLSENLPSSYSDSLNRDNYQQAQVGVPASAEFLTPEEESKIATHSKINDTRNWLDEVKSIAVGNIWTMAMLQVASTGLAVADPIDAVADPFSISLNGIRKLLWNLSPTNPFGLGASLIDENAASINATMLDAMSTDETAKAISWSAPDEMIVPGLGIPVGAAREWWDSKRDNKPSNALARMFYEDYKIYEDRRAALGEYQGPAAYAINNVTNLIGSVGASVLTGYLTGGALNTVGAIKFMPNLGVGKFNINALNNLNRFESYKKFSQGIVAFSQTGGESLMEGMGARDATLDRAYQEAGGNTYLQGLEQYTQNKYAQEVQLNPDLESDNIAIQAIKRKAKEEYRQIWGKDNPELSKKITEMGDLAFETAVSFNSLNFLLNLSIAGKYIQPSRAKILTNPAMIVNKETLKEMAQEYGEETINAVSQLMAESKVFEGHANATDFLKAYTKGTVHEQGAWGALGGGGQVTISNIINARDKSETGLRARYKAQQEVIKRYHDIENMSDANLIDKHVYLTNSLAHTATELARIDALHSQGKTAEAKAATSRLFVSQALTAFNTGTSASLVHMYEKLSENTNLSEDQRAAASAALENIKGLEKIFNNTQKYSNADEVFENEANTYLLSKLIKERNTLLESRTEEAIFNVKEALQEGKSHMSDNAIKFLSEIDLDSAIEDKFDTNLNEEQEKSIKNVREEARKFLNEFAPVKDFREINTEVNKAKRALGDLKKEHQALISNEVQQENRTINGFYKTMAEIEMIGQKEAKKKGKKFTPYTSKAYETFYMRRLEQLWEKEHISTSTRTRLKKDFIENKMAYELTEQYKKIQEASAIPDVKNTTPAVDNPVATNISNPDATPEVNAANVANTVNTINVFEQVANKIENPNQTFEESSLYSEDEFGTPTGASFAPRKATSKTTEDEWKFLKENMASYFEGLKNKIGVNPTFKDVVMDILENSDRDRTEGIYDFLAEAWDRNSKENPNKFQAIDAEKVHSEIFSPLSELRNNFFQAENFGEAKEEASTEYSKEEQIADIERRRQEELNIEQLPIDRVKRKNGAIGTQGVTTEQVANILENVLGLNIPENATMKDLVNLFLSDKANIDKLLEFTNRNPINITELPDGTIQINDGHHRAFLLDQAGITELPVTRNKSDEINAKYDAELAQLNDEKKEYALGDRVLNTPASTAGYSSHNYKQVLTPIYKEVNGERKLDFIQVSWVYEKTEAEEFMNEVTPFSSKFINAKPIVHPDKFTEGTKLVARTHPNFRSVTYSPIWKTKEWYDGLPMQLAEGEKFITYGDALDGVTVKIKVPLDSQIDSAQQEIIEVNIKIEEGSDEYWDTIPMVFTKEGSDLSEGSAFIHTPDWYHNSRFVEEEKKAVAIAETRAIRKAIREKGEVSLTITSKTLGTADKCKIYNFHDDSGIFSKVPLRESNPQSFIVIAAAESTGGFIVRDETGKLVSFDNEKRFIAGADRLREMMQTKNTTVFQLMRAGVVDGRDSYVGFPLYENDIHKTSNSDKYYNRIAQNIKWAIDVFMSQSDPNSVEAHKTAEEFYKATGYSIVDIAGLNRYISSMIQPMGKNVNSKEDPKESLRKVVEEAEGISQELMPNGTPYISFVGGQIQIGIKGKSFSDGKGGTFKLQVINRASKTNAQVFYNLQNTVLNDEAFALMARSKKNVSKEGFKGDQQFVSFKEDGTIDAAQTTTYTDFLMDTLYSDFKAVNIGTEANPFYTVFVQPTIAFARTEAIDVTKEEKQEFDSTGVISEDVKNKIKEKEKEGIPLTAAETEIKAKEPVVIPEAPVTENELSEEDLAFILAMSDSTNSLLSPEEREAIKSLEDLKKKKDESSLSPAISEEAIQRMREVSERIPGLLPHEQDELVGVLAQHIFEKLGQSEDSKLSDAEVTDLCYKYMINHISPLIESKQKEINRAKAIASAHPELTNLGTAIMQSQKLIDKCNLILDNRDLIINEVYQNIANENSVSERTIDETNLEKEEDLDIETSYSKSELEENVREQASSQIRKFLRGTVQRNSDGSIRTGFLGFPSPADIDSLFNTLTGLLADRPANLEGMLKILKEHSVAHPELFVKTPEGATEEEIVRIAQINKDTLVGRLLTADKQIQAQFVSLMTKHAVKMKFAMYSYNRRTKKYSLRVWDTNSSSVVRKIQSDWNANIMEKMTEVNSETGEYVMNPARAEYLLEIFDSWKGVNYDIIDLAEVGAPNVAIGLRELPAATINRINSGEAVEVDLRNNRANAPLTLMMNKRRQTTPEHVGIRASMAGKEIVITPTAIEGIYTISRPKKTTYTNQDLTNWLANVGITISPEVLQELSKEGVIIGNKRMKLSQMFQENAKSEGIFGLIAYKLREVVAASRRVDEEGKSTPKQMVLGTDGDIDFNDEVIARLAKIEAKYTSHAVSTSWRDNGKTIYGFSPTKFVTDRVNALKNFEKVDDKMVCQIIEDLKKVGFSKGALIIQLLENNPEFLNKFQASHIGITAIKEAGKAVYKDNGITQLSDADHELTKRTGFEDMKQGALSEYHITIDGRTYQIPMRMATMFGLTMSDKDAMFQFQTGVFSFNKRQNFELDVATQSITGINSVVKEILYQQTVLPELRRAVEFAKNGTTIHGHEGRMMFFFPALNNITITEEGVEKALIHVLMKGDRTLHQIEEAFKPALLDKLSSSVNNLVEEKIKIWEEEGFIVKTPAIYKDVPTGEFTSTEEESKIPIMKQELVSEAKTELKFFDEVYLNSMGEKKVDLQIQLAAYDYTLNYLIHNANMFMVFAGDPAQYYKKDKETSALDYVGIVRDTFTNIGKRMALLNAPGNKIMDSDSNKYIQLIMEDCENEAHGFEAIKRILGEEAAEAYKKNAGTDGQEYTTWQEHLYVLEKMGRTPESIMNITPTEIQAARELFSSKKNAAALTERDKLIIKKVLQPMKPVFTGSEFDDANGIMRTVYIKTSSFPLIPQLTEGLELDKLRKMMEKIQKEQGKTVRVAYHSGVKTGSYKKAMSAIDNKTMEFVHTTEDGRRIDLEDVDTNDIVSRYGMVLSRNNFRIQQDVPFKTAKREEDVVSMGTQMVKLMFGSGAMDINDFSYFGGFDKDGNFIANPNAKNGKEALEIYQMLFNKLITYKKQQLYKQLGLNIMGQIKNGKTSEERTRNAAEVAKRVQRILREEAIGRGYPKQDIESLELDGAGNFIIPIWLLSNGEKLESLLNAIVEKRVAKIKLPGNSYVVGSEVGFKVKVQKENEVSSKVKSGIIWINEEARNGLSHNQVLVASKFRNKEGKIIDLVADGYAIEKVEGKRKYWVLNKDKFDPDVLSMLNFRTPTSAHNSMSVDEIAGFLPHESADLMIVSRNKTTQKGIDFDIDKESAYQLWHTINEEGNIVGLDKVYSLSTIDSLIENRTKAIKKLKKEGLEDAEMQALEEWSYENEILEDLTEEEEAKLQEEFVSGRANELTKERLQDLLAKVSELKKIKEKLYHNEIIKLQTAVLSHKDMQKNMIKVLSMDKAEETASEISRLKENTQSEEFSPLSDEYQKSKVFLGASGKIAVGAYSLDVVGHSLFQQAKATGRQLQLNKREIDEEGKEYYTPYKVRFGKGDTYVSNGFIGDNQTLGTDSNRRLISDVLSERQNIATDNEKVQIMGRAHLNDITIDADKVLTMLGFDAGEDGHNISMLFLSQPIIVDYVNELRKISSNIAGFTKNKKEVVTQILVEKYGGQELYDHTSINDVEKASDSMTNEELKRQISNGGENKALQQAILFRFLDLAQLGLELRKVQTTINIDSKGLGISLFESLEKIQKVEDLLEMKSVTNADALVGDYKAMNETELTRIEMLNLGYVPLRNYYVKPSTVAGSFTTHALSTTYNLWSRYFPYDSETVNQIFTEIEEIIGATNEANESDGVKLRFEDKQNILREIKKYIFSSHQLGLFEGDAQSERYRLFMDEFELTPDKKSILHTKTSLAYYLKAVLAKENTPDIIKKNLFLKNLTFDIQKNGSPSTIKFNNTRDEGFDADAIYRSVTDLFTATVNGKPVELIRLNNKTYTSLDLAQDLMAYAYLEGGIQEVIQFVKFVPVSYLKEMPFSRELRRIHNLFTSVNPVSGAREELLTNTTTLLFGINAQKMSKKPGAEHKYSRATVQYIQHHPESIVKISEDSIRNGDITFVGAHKVRIGTDSIKGLGTLQEFATKGPNPPAFLSIYDNEIPKGQKKFQLFRYDSVSKTYKKIPVYGVFGMNEYNLNSKTNYYKSLVNKSNVIHTEVDEEVSPVQKPREIPTGDNPLKAALKSTTMLTDGHIQDMIAIFEADSTINPLFAELLKEFREAISKENIQLEVVDTIKNHITGQSLSAYGQYGNGKILLLRGMVEGSNNNTIARIYLHEIMHGLVNSVVDKYFFEAGSNSTPLTGAPQYIVRLSNLYKQARKEMGDDAFFQKFNMAEGLTEDQLRAYGGTQLKEFITEIMTNPHFQKRMASITYAGTNKTLYQKFLEFVKHTLSSLKINIPHDSITNQAILSVFELVQDKVGGILYSRRIEHAESFKKTVLNLQVGDIVTMEYFSETSNERDFKVRTVEVTEVRDDRIIGIDNISVLNNQSVTTKHFLFHNINAVMRVEKTPSTDIDIWYGKDENALSNLAFREFTFGGRKYISVEHAYQSLKSGEFDQETYDKYIIKGAGEKISSRKTPLTTDNYNLILMKDLIYASVKQNPKIAEMLVNTGNATLTHKRDSGIWKTEFPKILMQLRYDIKNTNFMSNTETFKAEPIKTFSELGTIEIPSMRIKFPDSATRKAKALTENFRVIEGDRLSYYWDASSLWEDLGVTSSEVREGEAFPLTAFAKDLMTKFEEEYGDSSKRSLEDWKAFVSEMLKLQELWHKQERNPLTKVLDSWFNYFEAEDSLVIFKELFSSPNMSIKQLRDFINGKLRYNVDDTTLIEFQNTVASAKEEFDAIAADNQLSIDFDNLPNVGYTVQIDNFNITIKDGKAYFGNGNEVTDKTILNKVHLETQADMNRVVEYNGYYYYVMPDGTIVSYTDKNGIPVNNYGKEAYANSEADRNNILKKLLEIQEVEDAEIEEEISEAKKLEGELKSKYQQAILKMRKTLIDYTQGQREALIKIQDFIDNKRKYFLLAGYAGTGKTTIVENIINYLNTKGTPVAVLAPTNKAVTVLRNKLAKTEAQAELSTIHRIIYGEPDPKTGEWIPKSIEKNTTYIIDESSMINEQVLNDMMDLFTQFNCKAIFIGDSFQLEPIDGDPKLFEWNNREFGKADQHQLTEVKRQEKGSILSIATFIRTIKRAVLPSTSEGGYKKLSEREFVADWQQAIGNGDDVILITSTNPSRVKYNRMARTAKWGVEGTKNVINDGEQMIAVNNSAVFSNGEAFEVTDYNEIERFTVTIPVNRVDTPIELIHAEVKVNGIPRALLIAPTLPVASLHGQQIVNYLPENLIDDSGRKPKMNSEIIVTTYGYAITAHKSQGSEWKKVYLDASWMMDSWDKARWIYTAVTRASQELVTFDSRYVSSTTFEEIDKTLNGGAQTQEPTMTSEYEIALKEAKSRPNTTYIPQNLQSGVKEYGTLQEANNKVKATLGPNPRSIDMIEAGFRTRTTRTVKELEKYNIKEGSYTIMFGTSANGKPKNVLVKITKITMGADEATWYKEGWTQEGFAKLNIISPATIEFEVVRKSDGNQQVGEQSLSPSAPIKEGVDTVFEQNPELANQVYEALGLIDEAGFKETSKYEMSLGVEKFTGVEPFTEKEQKEIKRLNLQQKQQALQAYSQYLDTIFPDSKVKDIVYHGRTKQDELVGNGFHFGTFKAAKERVSGRIERELFNDPTFDFENKQELAKIQKENSVYDNVIIDMQNPLNTKDWGHEEQWDRIVNTTRKNKEYDSLEYINQVEDKNSKSFVVFEPEQIHILGSKEDVEGFKDFIQKQSFSPSAPNTDLFSMENIEDQINNTTFVDESGQKIC